MVIQRALLGCQQVSSGRFDVNNKIEVEIDAVATFGKIPHITHQPPKACTFVELMFVCSEG